jgi:hypothetical protein
VKRVRRPRIATAREFQSLLRPSFSDNVHLSKQRLKTHEANVARRVSAASLLRQTWIASDQNSPGRLNHTHEPRTYNAYRGEAAIVLIADRR